MQSPQSESTPRRLTLIEGLVMVTLILVGCGWFKRGGSGGGS